MGSREIQNLLDDRSKNRLQINDTNKPTIDLAQGVLLPCPERLFAFQHLPLSDVPECGLQGKMVSPSYDRSGGFHVYELPLLCRCPELGILQ